MALPRFLTAFRADETGATAIEYGLLLALISVALLLALTMVGTRLRDLFDHLTEVFTAATETEA